MERSVVEVRSSEARVINPAWIATGEWRSPLSNGETEQPFRRVVTSFSCLAEVLDLPREEVLRLVESLDLRPDSDEGYEKEDVPVLGIAAYLAGMERGFNYAMSLKERPGTPPASGTVPPAGAP